MKIRRREALVSLLGGLGCLVGCSTLQGLKTPKLPERCYWLEFPYGWACVDLDKVGASNPSQEIQVCDSSVEGSPSCSIAVEVLKDRINNPILSGSEPIHWATNTGED